MNFSGVLLALALFMTPKASQEPSLAQARNLYQEAALEKEACNELLDLLEPVQQDTPVLYGYKGATTMISAQHVFNPFKKLSRFKEGRGILDAAISTANDAVELRYLRYSIQKNSPSFLGYNNQREEDRIFLENALQDLEDSSLRTLIIEQLNN